MRFKEILKEFDDGLGAIGDALAALADKRVKDTFKQSGASSMLDKPDNKLSSPTDTKKLISPNAKKTNTQSNKTDTKAFKDPDFNKRLTQVAEALGIAPSSLATIIKHESGGKPTAQDPWGVSGGLIGFTDKTARALGTTKADILRMSAVQQLDYVYKFYKMNKLKPGSDVGTMYMLTFMPAFAYAPDNTVLGQKGGGPLLLPSGKSVGLSMHKVWEQNPVFGKTKGKNYFTVGDVKKSVS